MFPHIFQAETIAQGADTVADGGVDYGADDDDQPNR